MALAVREWAGFFAAASGAAAALAGLAIVAISVNIARILAHPQLPPRAAATIGALVVALVASLAVLIPQRLATLGGELVFVGLAGWLTQLWSAARLMTAVAGPRPPLAQRIAVMLLGQVQALPVLVGGVWLMTAGPGGLAALAFGVLATFIGASLNCWVLLVEILR